MGPYVHSRLTHDWAEEVGLGDIAWDIAHADVTYDRLYPGYHGVLNWTRHFGPWAWLWSRAYFRRALAERSIEQLGWALHCAQDAISHGFFGHRHLWHELHLTKRSPDSWQEASERIRRRIREVTVRMLEQWRDEG